MNISMRFLLSLFFSLYMMLHTDSSDSFHSPLQEKAVKGSSHLPTAKHEWAPTCEDSTRCLSKESKVHGATAAS